MMRVCTKNLFGALEPEIEPKAEGNPLEVLELEHRLEAAVPNIGYEAKIRGAGIVFNDELGVEPAVSEPYRPPRYCRTGGIVVVVLPKVILISERCANLAPGRGEVLCRHNIHPVEKAVASAT